MYEGCSSIIRTQAADAKQTFFDQTFCQIIKIQVISDKNSLNMAFNVDFYDNYKCLKSCSFETLTEFSSKYLKNGYISFGSEPFIAIILSIFG